MALMDITRLCLDTGPLIAFLKGREPGATAVERVLREAECFVTVITILFPFYPKPSSYPKTPNTSSGVSW
jgi:hypothetical protein